MSETVVVKEWKKFRRYLDAAAYYGVSRSTIERIARDAGAIYKIHNTVLINCQILEEYLETCKLDDRY